MGTWRLGELCWFFGTGSDAAFVGGRNGSDFTHVNELSCGMPNLMSLAVVIQEVVRYLVEARADKDKVNQRGAPPIHMAALSGHVAVVQLLVDFGTDKDQSDCNGAGPLQLSAEQGQLAVVTYLTEVSCDLQKADLHGTVPLHMAALHGHLDVVRALVAAGAEKECADHHGAVPLHMAALNGETEPRCFRTRGLDDFFFSPKALRRVHIYS